MTLRRQIQELSEKRDLEALGKTLSSSQFLEVIDLCGQLKSGARDKLNPILAGVSQEVFSSTLPSFTQEQINTLRCAADGEPLQYHLTLVMRELETDAQRRGLDVEALAKRIVNYDTDRVVQAELDEIRRRIDAISLFFRHAIDKADQTLALVWSGNRPELVDKLTTLKENWIRYTADEVGVPRSSEKRATGLFALFDDHFGAIYSGGDEAHPLIGLSDDDGAIEALAALGVWYLEDYWKLGLLPEIKTVERLRLDAAKQSESALSERREELRGAVRHHLAQIGLASVGDFKQRNIYSKRILQRFIQDAT